MTEKKPSVKSDTFRGPKISKTRRISYLLRNKNFEIVVLEESDQKSLSVTLLGLVSFFIRLFKVVNIYKLYDIITTEPVIACK